MNIQRFNHEPFDKALGSRAKFRGRFQLECYGKDGRLKWTEDVHNLITDQGLDHILDAVLHGATQITTWYVVLFSNDFTPDGDETYAAPGFTEITTGIDNATRPAYNEAAASGQSITNSANKAAFTFNTSLNAYGAGILGGGSAPDTKGDAAGGGTLLCAARFSSARAVEDDDVLNVTYTLSAADDGV